MLKKIVYICAFTALVSSFPHAQTSPKNSASGANRRTAVRYLQLAKQFASEKLWEEADSNARMGLAYDDKIADLWYIRAVSRANLGEKKQKVLPLIMTALSGSDWVDYNKDGARILYADILCSTRHYEKALEVLDTTPFVYSADAEYIRSRSYYCMGDDESVSKARAKLDSARRVYPSDSRFAELFYTHEYQILRKSGSLSQEAKSLADAFALCLPVYKDARNDLEIYAAIFASDKKVGNSDSKKVRMLRAFNSKRLKSPLYAVEALRAALIDEDSALDYFYQFADKTIDITLLEDFASLLKTEEAKKEFSEYLNSYNGTLTFDTDSDLTVNMTVTYKRGRPEKISYDENQDDESEWKSECDFGTPLKLSLSENAVDLIYSSWPHIDSAVYKKSEKSSDITFKLVAETLAWTPFLVEADKIVQSSLGFDFFVPVLSPESAKAVSWDELIRSALSFSLPSSERNGAVIDVSLLDGIPQVANYSADEKLYAVARFENGRPVSRKIDVDGDGLFETNEFYGYSNDKNQVYISAGDELQVMTNLFGSPDSGSGFYVKKITVDRNGDTIPDFTEEYIPASVGKKIPGKISSWDTDGDGKWDVQYVKQPSMIDGKLREEAKFHQPLTDSVVTVSSENGIPVFVMNGSEILSVTKGSAPNFYWISDAGLEGEEEDIIAEIKKIGEQGVSTIVESSKSSIKRRFLAVRIEKLIFGMEIKK